MEVKFHLPGLRRNYPLNVMLLGMLKGQPHLFREGVTIGSCFGEFPTSLWNGGRNSRPDRCDEKFINMCIEKMNGPTRTKKSSHSQLEYFAISKFLLL